MLLPKKVKHRKWHKSAGQARGLASRGTSLAFGGWGLKSLTAERVTYRQIEAARRSMRRHMQQGGKIWIRIFPSKPITKKGSEVGMGGGAGRVDHFASFVEPGRVIFEIDGVPESVAREALRLAAHKLPVKTKIVSTITKD